MATPLSGTQHRDGGGVAVMEGAAIQQLELSNKRSWKSSWTSPIRIFLFFHKAIRSELDALHRAAVAFATDPDSDIKPLLERYHFLRSIYKHHCNAEDENPWANESLEEETYDDSEILDELLTTSGGELKLRSPSLASRQHDQESPS